MARHISTLIQDLCITLVLLPLVLRRQTHYYIITSGQIHTDQFIINDCHVERASQLALLCSNAYYTGNDTLL